MYLMIDNYDSFTYNLFALFRKCGAEVKVIRNSEFISAEEFRGIILSPGPSTPQESGSSMRYLETYGGRKPIFGVCLGMQCIGRHLGYDVVRARTVRHGKLDKIAVRRKSLLYRGLPEHFSAVRYHSLAVDAAEAHVTSVAEHDGEVMSIEDEERMLFGVQYHPESIMSECGESIVRNFLDFAEARKGIAVGDILKRMNAGDAPEMDEADRLFEVMLTGGLTDSQIASVLISMKGRGETPLEVAALVRAMRRHKRHFGVSAKGLVDTCGTGGDGKSTVNVSTAVSIILASMGYPVVKHGNSAQSGKVGSADILADVGFDAAYGGSSPEEFFSAHNYVFLFAPQYHPALKQIGRVRRELGVPTIFNLVGPLANPADPAYQIIGLSGKNRLELVSEAVSLMGCGGITLYASDDGFDEVSSAAKTECRTISGGSVESFFIDPADFFDPFEMPVVRDRSDAKDLFLGGISGRDGRIADLFALNAALALKTMGVAELPEGYGAAREQLASGRAAEKLERMVRARSNAA
ncbi:MAG: anthranilate phosphoribosyltransferase [Spirochaetes bacterium]|nr:anthranilate phosphoribosyltransferase [Spirochaetota bacterium]